MLISSLNLLVQRNTRIYENDTIYSVWFSHRIRCKNELNTLTNIMKLKNFIINMMITKTQMLMIIVSLKKREINYFNLF